MKRRLKCLAVAVLLAGAMPSAVAQAHAIWFAQRSTQLALVYGVGADDLDAVKRLPLIKHVAGYDAHWTPVPVSLRVAGPLLLVDSDGAPAAVSAVLDNGIWSKTPDGKWHKKGKDEVPDAIVSEHTMKYAVHIRGQLSHPVPSLPTQTLQIVPVAAKLPQMMGEPMKLRVLYNGAPVAGARVLADYVNDPDAKPAETGEDGTVVITVRNQGLNVIAAFYDIAMTDSPKVNKVENLATLSFVLAHKPE
ncbi:MAG: DUF4198 domain-containing protein [Alphaproteobacteria bacterium]|nr:MAG: DUF4198 domain-containing protein [Alphaproteobacteria bacterium]